MQSLGQFSMASSIHSSSPSGSITPAFSVSLSKSNTSGQSSTQLSHPTHSSVSMYTLFAIVLLLLGLAGCGGLDYQKFVRYAPVTQVSFEPDSLFKPDISPNLNGRISKTIIPLFLYYRAEEDGPAVITIQTEHKNDLRYGYDGIAHVRFDSLVAELPDGTTKTLIQKESPVHVPLNTEGWASRRFDLGKVDSDEMTIIASGVTIKAKDNSQSPFTYKQAWKKYKSSRLNTSLAIME